MKKFLLFLVLVIASATNQSSSFAQSPDWLWAKSMGGTDSEGGYSIAVDASGNVYTTGYFVGTADFDPGAGVFNLTSAGQLDIFISKFDSSGNFVWAMQLGGTGNDFPLSIAIDPTSRDVYTTGTFEGTADFDPGAGIFNLMTSAGGGDIFISKLDSSGNFVWAKAMGGTGYAQSPYIAIDPAGSGDVYTTGQFGGTVDFDPGAGVFNLTSAIIANIFISKLDSSGNFVWAKAMGGNATGRYIVIDPAGSGDVYTTGYFDGAGDFDPGVGIFNLTSAGYWDIFISKLDSSGNFVWAKAIGGINADYGISIAIDPAGSGDVYTTGWFEGAADFDPGAGIFNLSSAGEWDIFISKLNSSGNFVLAKAIGGNNADHSFSIAVDPAGSGDVYTTGWFEGTADFDPGTGVFNLTEAGGGDIFISKLDSLGNFVWAKAIGGTNDESGYSITFDGSGHVYATGSFASPTISFGSTILINANNSGNTGDIFIAKLDTAIVTGINPLEKFEIGVSIYPNPFSHSTSLSFYLSKSEKVSLQIFDGSGRLVSILADKIFEVGKYEIVWNAEDVNAGVYFLQFQTPGSLQNEKLIVTKN